MNIRKILSGKCLSVGAVLAAILMWGAPLAQAAEQYTIPLFVTAGAGAPQGVLRILNDTEMPGTVAIHAIDDAGMRFGPATVTLSALAAVEFTAADLQSGNAAMGLTVGLGTLSGDVRLLIESSVPIVPLAFVRAADGTLSAMHDTVRAASRDVSDLYTYDVPVFNPSTEMTQASRLRLINPGDTEAAVTITGRDDSGAAASGGDVTLTLAAGAARTLTAQQLEAGESTMDSTEQPTVADGTCYVGLQLEAGERCTYPGTTTEFSVTAEGRGRFQGITSGGGINISSSNLDFAASHQGGGVWRIDRVEGRTETSGDGNTNAGGSDTDNRTVTGQLGAGTDKWRLTVSSDRPLQVVNIVEASAGYLNNLSTSAAPGAAPANLKAFDKRFIGNPVVYEAVGARSTFNALVGERFRETEESDGGKMTFFGSYGYESIGPDAGRLTIMYDGGDVCQANLYFSSRTSGWFATHCTGSDFPAEGAWLSGGTWFVEGDEGDGDGGGEVTPTAYGVDDRLPGVPTSGVFVPAMTSGGSVMASGAGTTIALNERGYVELNDGTRYTCTAPGGCTIVNGTVTAGTVSGRAAGSGEVDRFPTFRTATGPGNQTYTVGTAIDALTLPAASGGNGALTYSLSPDVPGLTFDATARQLSGTPTAADTYAMTYTAMDEDGDTNVLGFTITVEETGTADDHGDTFGTATSVSVPSTTQGVLEEGKEDGDRDYFRVVVSAATTLTVRTTGTTDTYGTLFDGGQTQQVTNDDGGSGTNFRIERQVQAGTYYVEVRGYQPSRTGTYELHVSAADDGGDQATTFGAGDTISSMPTGSWTPDMTSGGSFSISSGNVTIQLANGGYIEEGSYRYTCQSAGGCTVRNRNVVSGAIIQTSTDTAGGGNTGAPDLTVESARVSDATPSAGASFTLSATVRNRGDASSPATTLRYYRSANATISTSDTLVGTDAVGGLAASGTSAESISLTTPSSAGTYYYGACVDSVTGESDTDNNCSGGVRVSVSSGETGGGDDGACIEVNDVIELGEGESCTITQALVDKYSLNRVSVRLGDTARCSGGRVTLSFLSAVSIHLNGLTIRCR